MFIVTPRVAAIVPDVDGVTLEQYAGVGAALIEGFPLLAALENDGLDARAWPSVSMRWSHGSRSMGRAARFLRRMLTPWGSRGSGSGAGRAARGRSGRAVRLPRRVVGAPRAVRHAPAPPDFAHRREPYPGHVGAMHREERGAPQEGARARQEEAARGARLEGDAGRAEPFPWTKKRAPVAEESALVRPKLSSSFVGDAFGLERYASRTPASDWRRRAPPPRRWPSRG